ncbi:MAG: type II secretion system protein [Gemmatimonadetes bacterium]|nr:type II secretion system protein [Gemmatimonadota bacterium]
MMMSRRGFTLIEVVVALLVLEMAVVGVLGTMALAARTLHRAERLEAATGRAEAVLDSLRRGASPASGMDAFDDVSMAWTVDTVGRVELEAVDERGGLLLAVRTRVPLR